MKHGLVELVVLWLYDSMVVCSNLVGNKIDFFIFGNIMVTWMWKGGKTLDAMGSQGSWEKQPIMVIIDIKKINFRFFLPLPIIKDI